MLEEKVYIRRIQFSKSEKILFYLTTWDKRNGYPDLWENIYFDEKGQKITSHPKFYDSLSEVMMAANKFGFKMPIFDPHLVICDLEKYS